MSTRWFYSRSGKTVGPLPAEEIRALAARGKIAETDLVWPEDSGPDEALPAQAVLEIKEASGGALPEWLEDVKSAERRGPLPPPEPQHDLPEWIDDLRAWMALDVYDPAIPWDESLGPPPLQNEISRAVETWFAESSRPAAEAAPAARAAVPRSPVAVPAVAPPVAPLATRPPATKQSPAVLPIAPRPVQPVLKPAPPEAPPPAPAPPLAAPVEPQLPAAAPVVAAPSSPAAAPARPGARVMPVQAPPGRRDLRRRATDLVAEQAIKESGFDPRTGEIVDSGRFAQWKQQKAQPSAQGTQTNAGLMEVFRQARTQMEAWLDEEANRPLVLGQDLEAIRRHPDIQATVRAYEGYGPAFRAKLLRHLDFMAENRCKYYTARPRG